jgi:TIR domain
MQAFISHDQEDSTLYSSLCLALTGANIPRWDPTSMIAGRSLAGQLKEAIQSCDVCVFLATRRSLESKWCAAEVGAFWGAGKTVVVFLADPTVKESDLPPQFQGYLWASDAGQLIDAITASTVPDEIWYTQWPLGKTLYKEELHLHKADNNIRGKRFLFEANKVKWTFSVSGFEGKGLYWLEYHREDRRGGGTLLLYHAVTGSKLMGFATAGHCDLQVLRCYYNSWVPGDSKLEYEESSFKTIGLSTSYRR